LNKADNTPERRQTIIMTSDHASSDEAAVDMASRIKARQTRGSKPSQLPPQSWDSHMHVFEPHSLDHDAAPYRPIPSDLPRALAFEARLGLRNIVLVQPSCYGHDNTYLLQALKKLGPRRARGVVAFDPRTTTVQDLQSWHRLGVRGVRINLKSVNATTDRAAFEALLTRYADSVRPLRWVVQLYVPMELAAWLEDLAAVLDVKLCLDHFGCPDLSSVSSSSSSSSPSPIEAPIDPYEIPGFRSVINLLAQGKTYIKFSGAYRVSQDPYLRDLTPVAKELLRVAGATRIVFATDWPHTRFNGLDIAPFVQQCIQWCDHDDVLINRIFRGTAEELWDVKERNADSDSNRASL
jgi:predicted TIM-barrel fold metal-dependent hydrolase